MKPLTPEAWIRKLAFAEEESRKKVAEFFTRFPEEQQDHSIHKSLSSSDTRIRRATYALIGELKASQYHRELLDGLSDKNSSVLQMVVWAVGRCQVVEAIPIMNSLIDKGIGFKISKTIIWAWGEMKDRSVLPMLVQMLKGASARQLEGILVTSIKLGEKSFFAILQQLDPNDLLVRKALVDFTSASSQARYMIGNAVQRDAFLSVNILPWVSFSSEDYATLLQTPQENIRLACYQSLQESALPFSHKRPFFISALQDESNRIVQVAIEALATNIFDPHVNARLHELAKQHPSPKIRSQITTIWQQEENRTKFINHVLETTDHFLLQTLPGLERFVKMESHALGLSIEVENTGDGWLAIYFNKSEFGSWKVLKKLHTVSLIAVVVSKNDQWNPHLDLRLLSDSGNVLEITYKNMKYRAITLATEGDMQRPQRQMRTTSLDWRVARAITLLSQPTDTDVFVDPTCGSGMNLLSRADFAPYQQLWGNDIDPHAIKIAKRNLRHHHNIDFHIGLAQHVPLNTNSVDVVVANLPFGRRVGNHEANLQLYPLLMQETVRLLRSGGHAIFLTQEVKLLKRSLQKYATKLKLTEEYAVAMGGLTPHLLCLHKR